MIEFLIRVGELTLKGENRASFEKQLAWNIKRPLRDTDCSVRLRRGRFFLTVAEPHERRAERVLRTTCGIVGFARDRCVDKRLDLIADAAIDLAREAGAAEKRLRFRIRSRRTDKSFPLSSHRIEETVGAAVTKEFPLLSVNLSDPELVIHIEIRDAAYLYGNDTPGPSGLPVGCAGRGVLLLSGGIDSPVAGFFMTKRGLKLDAVYFDTYPYTSIEAREKVETLAGILADYNVGLTLYTVPFTDIALHIRATVDEAYTTLLIRACMMEIASLIARRRRALALVTGESLSQVASQTVESLRFTDAHAAFPVYRPLIGFDKQETITWARRIGTYETSIRPYEDCCTVFTPTAPKIRPELRSTERMFSGLSAGRLFENALENTCTRWFEPHRRDL